MRISDWSSDVCSSDLLDQLSLSIQIRRIRRSHFGTAEMSGPVWDMMLDLMLAGAHGRVLSASDLATGPGVPLSSRSEARPGGKVCVIRGRSRWWAYILKKYKVIQTSVMTYNTRHNNISTK